jgi:hypothetical protein
MRNFVVSVRRALSISVTAVLLASCASDKQMTMTAAEPAASSPQEIVMRTLDGDTICRPPMCRRNEDPICTITEVRDANGTRKQCTCACGPR